VNFLFPWLLWQRAAKKKREELAKVSAELGKSEVILDLAKRDPKMREALRSLGLNTSEKENPDPETGTEPKDT
jgi:hypothetical protein